MIGDPETTWLPGDYVFYPKGFVHSPDDGTDAGAHIVIRLSGPMSYVNGELPKGRPWTRADERQLLPGQANSRRPVSRLRTGDWPWEDLMVDGTPTGERIKVLSVARETGAVTFLSRVEAGWSSPLAARQPSCARMVRRARHLWYRRRGAGRSARVGLPLLAAWHGVRRGGRGKRGGLCDVVLE